MVENFWTPLHEACHKGLTSILEKFLNTNCDLNVRNEEGATPLYISCQYGQKQCLQMLLDHGANAEIPVFSGDTPLHIACQEGYYDCVASLLNKGRHTHQTHDKKVISTLWFGIMESSRLPYFRVFNVS